MSFRLSYRADPGNPWFSWQYVRDNSDTVLAALREHTTLTLRAVLVAALIAVPLAVVAYWFRPLAGPILALTGVLYTVPSLAVFAFVAPYLGIGVATVLSVVVLYALLVIIRNTVAGLNQVPAEIREAAEGMGYGRWGRLLRIELPLAVPGILTGLRLATVSTVALVTVGVVIGRGGLGQIIFAGFQNNLYKAQIMTGTLLCVLLALVLDLFLVAAGRLLTPWLRGRTG
ncbi:ABC transporter permease [Micromonospora sp. HNM0581]|uniref:ABC transporter permease n=1 Tax=Micromonospora sp. HNM0581 TaxID=2716341 RepID=UPI00146F2411|nr:ABC transporter permease [Micromonospora sp. HNM0581]NLU77357.1 ABC transporter permease [Micromonospora sp. HNM0581]